jgi:hypothetical protein
LAVEAGQHRSTAIGCYRWHNVAFDTLLYPALLHSTPCHSHSIALIHRNVLI